MTTRSIAHGYLHLSEKTFDQNDTLPELDVFIFCHSWEARSTDILKRLPNTKIVVKIEFSGGVAPQAEDAEAEIILKTAISEERLIVICLQSSLNIQPNCVALHKSLAPLVSQAGLRVGLDMSSIPKSYSMSIIGWCIAERRLPALKLMYSEGIYDHETHAVDGDAANLKAARFTSGPWRLTSVPYLEGNMATEDGRKLVAFCGGDHQDILNSLATYEHLDRWAIITSENPQEPDAVALRHAQSFNDNSGIDPKQVHFANPMSAVDALVRAREIFRPRNRNEGEGGLVLPFSTKPHAIAAAVLSLFDPQITILARCPKQYMAPQIHGSGKGVVVTLSDLSSPLVASFLEIHP